jgi:hypothetical protein
MTEPTRELTQARKLSEDDSLNGWESWKQRAEEIGLPSVLSPTALMLLWLALGTNAWRKL